MNTRGKNGKRQRYLPAAGLPLRHRACTHHPRIDRATIQSRLLEFRHQPQQYTFLHERSSSVFALSFSPPGIVVTPTLRIRSICGDQNGWRKRILWNTPYSMNGVSMLVYLTNKDARPFSERRVFFDQQGILNPFKYFMYGDSIKDQFIVPMLRDSHFTGKDEHTDTSECVTHLFKSTASSSLRQPNGDSAHTAD